MPTRYVPTNVFTPSSIARLNFVERATIQNRMVDALETPGKQLVVYGHTGSGKSTVVMNKLFQTYEDQVVTRCTANTTFEDMLLDAFDQLEPFYADHSTRTLAQKGAQSVSVEYMGIKAGLDQWRSTAIEKGLKRIIPPPLSLRSLATFMGEAKACWVLEDFHKLHPEQKTNITQGMKIFVDMSLDYPDLRTIAIGAVGSAREVIDYEPEMRNRIVELEVPLMSEREIRSIIVKGARLLNISFHREIRKTIITLSNGLAASAHQMCLNLCRLADIKEKVPGRSPYPIGDKYIDAAVERYIEGEKDSIKAQLSSAMRTTSRAKFDHSRLILRAIAEHPSMEGLTKQELLDDICSDIEDYPSQFLSRYINELCSPKRYEILRIDSDSNRIGFVNPFHKAYLQAQFKQEDKDRARRKSRSKALAYELVGISNQAILEFTLQYIEKRRLGES